jgi:CrcB protein
VGKQIFFVALGGAIGALARWGLAAAIQRPGLAFPLGTLVINVLGCLAIGVVMALVEERASISPETRLFLAVGILGSFTTFSTFGFETIALLRDREHLLAFLSVAGNLGIGLAAVVAGRALVRAAL